MTPSRQETSCADRRRACGRNEDKTKLQDPPKKMDGANPPWQLPLARVARLLKRLVLPVGAARRERHHEMIVVDLPHERV